VGVRHDLICGQGDQCAAAHGVVRDDRGHIPVVVGDNRRDLARRRGAQPFNAIVVDHATG
jgi:hypothetical protein